MFDATHKKLNKIVKSMLTEKFYELYPQWKAGNIKAVEFRKIINMTKPTFYRRVKEYETLLSKESE